MVLEAGGGDGVTSARVLPGCPVYFVVGGGRRAQVDGHQRRGAGSGQWHQGTLSSTSTPSCMADTPQVWIFNTDIRYTHTHAEGSIRGVKVFWMLVKEGESVVTDSLKATGFEGVALGREAFETLRKCLVDSNAALPRDAGRSGEWMVGALRRFEAAGE